MRPVITPAEAERLDGAAADPVTVLMERAGLGVALAASRMGAGYGSRVAVLAGTGNNGGDAYVAARHLRRRGADVTVYARAFPKGEYSPARKAAAAAAAAGVVIEPWGPPAGRVDLVIDGLFGAGFHGRLPAEVEPWLEVDAPVLAIDLPSGLEGLTGAVTGPAFTATRTVTFDALKVAHVMGEGPDRCGLVEVVPIGLPAPEPEFWLCEDSDAPVPARSRTDHKWSVGSVAVVGGSAGLVGAAVLAASAALEFGAGAVRLITPGGVRSEAAAGRPGLMTGGIGTGETFGPDDVGLVLEAVGRFDVLVFGPGIGKGRGGLIDQVIARWDRPLVLDADGISGASLDALQRRSAPTVITPHAGEFTRLTGTDATHEAAFRVARETGLVIVLKGNPTVVAGAERWVVTSGGPELATIGTGDVLAGMVGALVARGLPVEVAARSAAHRHGLAGRAGAAQGVTAEGLLREIGRWAS